MRIFIEQNGIQRKLVGGFSIVGSAEDIAHLVRYLKDRPVGSCYGRVRIPPRWCDAPAEVVILPWNEGYKGEDEQ